MSPCMSPATPRSCDSFALPTSQNPGLHSRRHARHPSLVDPYEMGTPHRHYATGLCLPTPIDLHTMSHTGLDPGPQNGDCMERFLTTVHMLIEFSVEKNLLDSRQFSEQFSRWTQTQERSPLHVLVCDRGVGAHRCRRDAFHRHRVEK